MTTYSRSQEVEHVIGPTGRFTLRVTSSDTEITGTDEPVARLRITHEIRAGSDEQADQLLEHARFDVKAGEGSVEVSEPRRSEGLGALARVFGIGGSAAARVEAWIPRRAEIEYNGVSADLTGTEMIGTQRYRTISGDLVLDRVAGDLRVQGVSADVSIRADAALSLDAHNVSGDLSAVAPAFESLRVVTVSGDVELEGSLAVGGSHRVETVSGDLSLGLAGGLTLEVRGLSTDVDLNVPHRTEGSRDRRRYVVGDGAAQLAFSSMSGDVSIGAPRRLSGIAPTPPVAPVPPLAPAGAPPPAQPLPPTLSAEQQLHVLQALERGEIDVDEAARRLATESTDV